MDLNILDYADNFKVILENKLGDIMGESPVEDTLAFGTPEQILLMMEFYGITKGTILDGSNIELMKTTINAADNEGRGLFSYIFDLSSKLGGRGIQNFNNRALAYQKLINIENSYRQRAESIRSEINTFEIQNGDSDNL